MWIDFCIRFYFLDQYASGGGVRGVQDFVYDEGFQIGLDYGVIGYLYYSLVYVLVEGIWKYILKSLKFKVEKFYYG